LAKTEKNEFYYFVVHLTTMLVAQGLNGVSNDWMIVNNELERVRNEVVVAQYKSIRLLPGGTAQRQEKR
jgi:hypothetical protein